MVWVLICVFIFLFSSPLHVPHSPHKRAPFSDNSSLSLPPLESACCVTRVQPLRPGPYRAYTVCFIRVTKMVRRGHHRAAKILVQKKNGREQRHKEQKKNDRPSRAASPTTYTQREQKLRPSRPTSPKLGVCCYGRVLLDLIVVPSSSTPNVRPIESQRRLIFHPSLHPPMQRYK